VATALNDDIHCARRVAGVCNRCYQGFYLNSATKKCTAQNLLCRELEFGTGACTACYIGYVLVKGQCGIAT